MKRNLFLSLMTGVLLALAFPPQQLGFLAYIALIPWFFLLEDKSLKESFRWGYLTGLFINIGTIYWVSWVTLPGAIAAVLYLPLFCSLYAMLHSFLRQRLGNNFVFAIPFLWTAIEYLRSLGVLGFPWTSLGYTQTYYLSLIQYASFTSIYGVSFWVVTINTLLFVALKSLDNLKKCCVIFLAITVLLILPWVYGKIVIPDDDEFQEKIRVALIQGNIDPYMKWDNNFRDLSFEVYLRLTREIGVHNPDLIIWPETATPCYLRYEPRYLNLVRGLVNEMGVPLLTGSPDFSYVSSNEYLTFNSALLLQPGELDIKDYAKIHLVPFGERVPFTEVFPFSLIESLLEKLEMGQGNFSPGKKVVVFSIPVAHNSKVTTHYAKPMSENNTRGIVPPDSVRFSVVICFESIFPELVGKFIKKGAQFLVVITNDAWFGKTSAPYQHARMAIFRAIENRIAIARCANTGVSMFIDPYGRITKASPIFEEATLVSDVPLRHKETFFTAHGNIFSITISIASLIPLLIALFKFKKARS